MNRHVLTGFGFGPIQAGLFLNEAFKSGNFSRLVVSEIDDELVAAVMKNKGTFSVNVARADRIDVVSVSGVELLNPVAENDREKLIEAISSSTEIATCLPSVSVYEAGTPNSVADLIAQGLLQNSETSRILYTAENNNHAAEILEQKVTGRGSKTNHATQYLNTVIGKMSQVVVGEDKIKQMKLTPIAPLIDRAFLVEEFNRIFVNRCMLEDFRPGIEVFIEKENLLPFEEAKLYGHNAVHALLAYLGRLKGCRTTTEVADKPEIMRIARNAFINESGSALVTKYTDLGDPLFTEEGYAEYADDLLARMTNPFLADTTERLARDPVRKLGFDDRIFGTMNLALGYGIEPDNIALAALSAVAFLIENAQANKVPLELSLSDYSRITKQKLAQILHWIWAGREHSTADKLIDLVYNAKPELLKLVKNKTSG